MRLKGFIPTCTLLLVTHSVNSQSCFPNINFDSLSWSGWAGYTATGSPNVINWINDEPAWTFGIVTLGVNIPQQVWCSSCGPTQPHFHTLLNVPPGVNNPPYNCPGWDSIAINASTLQSDIPFHSPLGGPTARLGNKQGNFRTEKLEYDFTVTSQSSDLKLAFAIVFARDDFGSEFSGEGAFFKMRLSTSGVGVIDSIFIEANQFSYDSTLFAAPPWVGTYYDTASSSALANYFIYRKWETRCYDLGAYVGQPVRIEFQTGDCIFGGHFSYAYVDAGCSDCSGKIDVSENPSPNNNFVIVDPLSQMLYVSGPHEGGLFTLYSLSGQVIYSGWQRTFPAEIYTGTVPTGIYIGELKTVGGNYSQKISIWNR